MDHRALVQQATEHAANQAGVGSHEAADVIEWWLTYMEEHYVGDMEVETGLSYLTHLASTRSAPSSRGHQ